ncbi:sulfurtransferase [Halorientalis litorea]|uniref:sulfurtransferase n=1 Tax=Halorientalis litorea TaxID=2931977 RepID=UPI001FF62CF0|nr:sulfurtransferase [Halorientalis litorea]
MDPDWLEPRLHESDLRVVDCTLHLSFDPETGARHTESGRADWDASHIPGSVYVNVQEDLTAADPDFPYQRPSPARFADAMASLGISDDTRVVLYDRARNSWAARVWWLLRSFGFDRAGILNGGWERWTADGRPTSTDRPEERDATFTPDPHPELVADKEQVQAAIEDEACSLVNALRPADFDGSNVVKYGRPGHVPGSVNVPAVGESAIVDAADQTYLPRDALRARFADAGVTESERVITYCGGGIAASSAAFALHLLGVENVAVYDGSMAEWGRTDLPIETD